MIANGFASFHNLFMMAVHFFGDHTFKDKGLQLVIVAILDMVSKPLFFILYTSDIWGGEESNTD